ncbi:hypothetical protein D3C80_1065680 [compost metagenome]
MEVVPAPSSVAIADQLRASKLLSIVKKSLLNSLAVLQRRTTCSSSHWAVNPRSSTGKGFIGVLDARVNGLNAVTGAPEMIVPAVVVPIVPLFPLSVH